MDIEHILKSQSGESSEHLYTEEFWQEVEKRVEQQNKEFENVKNNMRISHKRLHESFTI